MDFDWRRIRDNLCLLQPETLVKINHLIVAAGHELVPEAIEAVRGDTFVVETNIHYPTESSLIGDGLRKVVTLAAELAEAARSARLASARAFAEERQGHRARDWPASRAKSQGADRLKPGYQRLLSSGRGPAGAGPPTAADA